MSDKQSVIFVGAGGQARAVIESLPALEVTGYFDDETKDQAPWNSMIHLGSFDELNRSTTPYSLHLSFGKLSASSFRKDLFVKLKSQGHTFPTLLSDTSTLSSDVFIGEGSVIMRSALLNFNVHIGDNCIINNGAIIEHDVSIGSHTHIGPGVIISADVEVGSDCYLANGAVVGKGVKLPHGTILQPGEIRT